MSTGLHNVTALPPSNQWIQGVTRPTVLTGMPGDNGASGVAGVAYPRPLFAGYGHQHPPMFPTGPVQTPAGPLAHSIQLAQMPALPTPDQLAPCVFNNHMPYGYGYMPPGANSFYNYNQAPYYPWSQPQQPPQNPAAQPLPPQQQQPPQDQKPPEPPKPADKPAENPKQLQGDMALTPEMVQRLNADLSDSSYTIRMKAANKLGKILQLDPDIMNKPQYSQYAEALVLKALNDPDSLVRTPILLAMQIGGINKPTPKMLDKLRHLQTQNGMYGFEKGDIGQILSDIKHREIEAKQQAEAMAKAQAAQPPQHQFPPGVIPPVASGNPAAVPMMPGNPRSAVQPPMVLQPGFPQGIHPQMPRPPVGPPNGFMPPAYPLPGQPMQPQPQQPGQRLNMVSR